ncbi:D-alanyl-D-alanine carboxypeptidase family protein [Trujillonella endophytica]|uniref:D-alanyl-D-alanine carboxypeptidase (Penicillin-binding protein 5/6) n=1 Tax=Trujillonella endophytica TaxID=673521 RepID=A0A1H8RS21_9ACTN|nr:serine hydrolase [Trujillella endophytica]SEO69170.1 D-alanyl-D-alanine carboxypeptidase (penicillin-binding protein 5/6) [Trujillella endophytica]
MRTGAGRRLAGAVLALAVVLIGGAGPGLAEPARPTVDRGAPTPTAPYPGRPPQGSAPNGGTVGGEGLDTRGLVVADGTPPLPEGIAARGWLVADALSGEVLAARDPHGRYYPASTLKTLTLLTLAPRLDPAQVVEGTVEDEQVEGSRVGLVAGGRYPVSLLFLALVLQSGNDAANALARAAGGIDATLAAMNATAEEIGAFDTVAGTPSGLDVAGQSSSPYDLALVFRRLVADPGTAAVLATPTAQMPPVEGRSPGYQIQNQNPLAGYLGTLGGKTGFTDAARHTFVTAAERGGRRLVVSVMDTENVPLRAADQAGLLLDWGFATDPATGGVGRLVDSGAEEPAAPDPTSAAPPPPADARPARTDDGDDGPGSTTLAVGVALAVAAAGVVVATVVGRRRAVIRTAGPPPAAAPPGGPPEPGPPEGASPSTRP